MSQTQAGRRSHCAWQSVASAGCVLKHRPQYVQLVLALQSVSLVQRPSPGSVHSPFTQRHCGRREHTASQSTTSAG